MEVSHSSLKLVYFYYVKIIQISFGIGQSELSFFSKFVAHKLQRRLYLYKHIYDILVNF